ncbi:MAG: hypothetical protein K5787_12560, partial [Lentisphaeria bacterium]|nr:hypothetical protein [Lentisphaeria bacterium]
ELELRKSGFIPQAESIKLNDVLKGGGIKMFLDNFNNALKGLPEDRAIEAWNVMKPFLDQLQNQMKSLVGNVDDSRMGNEILINARDF